MSSSPARPVPTPPTDALLHVAVRPPTVDLHPRDRSLPDWEEQVGRMDPDDLRLLAISLPLIEQAKGVLMGHYGIGADTAFAVLRRWSSSRQLKLRDLAAALVEEASRGDVGRDATRPTAVERFLEAHGLG
jgi:hypothetical protein